SWDGVICRHRDEAVLRACLERKIPCVDLDDSRPPLAGVPKVRPDNRAAGHMAAEHFLDRGFAHFAFCGLGNELWSCERRDGFIEAVEAAGEQSALFETPYFNELNPEWDLSEKAAIRAWLKTLPVPCGLFACNDLRALQVIEAAQEAELRIPDELAVLGANNETVRAELSHPPLSSVDLNALEWGHAAARILHAQLDDKTVPAETPIEPRQVVVRRSTDAVAIEDPAIAKAVRIIREEACQQLRVDELARRVSVSRSLLERRFRKILRRTPQEEIRNIKIRRTKQYLLETDKPLGEIAELTGFEHPEYLSVMFKRLTGETPRDFRQRHRVSA
ncbi:MAG: XylR family transcriptional regulator, partial [Verrucomicrobiota bacterium]